MKDDGTRTRPTGRKKSSRLPPWAKSMCWEVRILNVMHDERRVGRYKTEAKAIEVRDRLLKTAGIVQAWLVEVHRVGGGFP